MKAHRHRTGCGAANKLINFLMAFFNGLASGILGFNAQNLGKNDKKRIRQGTLQSLVIMLVIYAVCLAAGLALSVGGTYQYIFMSADKVTAESIMYGNTYIYIDIILYFVLGFLIVVRSAVQGVCLVGYVLGAGTAELTSRILICSFLPRNCKRSSGQFFSLTCGVCSGVFRRSWRMDSRVGGVIDSVFRVYT